MPASTAACKTGLVERTRRDCRSGWWREWWIQSSHLWSWHHRAARQNERRAKSAWEYFKKTEKLVAGGSWNVACTD